MGATSTTHLPPIFLLGMGGGAVATAMHLLQGNWELFQSGWSGFGQPAHPFPLNSPEQQFQPVLNSAFFAGSAATVEEFICSGSRAEL